MTEYLVKSLLDRIEYLEAQVTECALNELALIDQAKAYHQRKTVVRNILRKGLSQYDSHGATALLIGAVVLALGELE